MIRSKFVHDLSVTKSDLFLRHFYNVIIFAVRYLYAMVTSNRGSFSLTLKFQFVTMV